MKLEKGITMVSLIVTLVILMIISALGVSLGLNSVKTVEDRKLTSELLMVQHAVLEQYAKYQTVKDINLLVGNKMQLAEVQNMIQGLGITLATIPQNYSHQDYYRLDEASLLKLGIKDTKDEYIVNYISGEVINITKKTASNGTALYIRANSFYQ